MAGSEPPSRSILTGRVGRESLSDGRCRRFGCLARLALVWLHPDFRELGARPRVRASARARRARQAGHVLRLGKSTRSGTSDHGCACQWMDGARPCTPMPESLNRIRSLLAVQLDWRRSSLGVQVRLAGGQELGDEAVARFPRLSNRRRHAEVVRSRAPRPPSAHRFRGGRARLLSRLTDRPQTAGARPLSPRCCTATSGPVQPKRPPPCK